MEREQLLVSEGPATQITMVFDERASISLRNRVENICQESASETDETHNCYRMFHSLLAERATSV